MFGPCITMWYRFLNRITFASPTRALIYRVCFVALCLLKDVDRDTCLGPGMVRSSDHFTRSVHSTPISILTY